MEKDQGSWTRGVVAISLLVGLVPLQPGEAWAIRERIDLQTGRVITSPRGHSRVLLDFGDLSSLDDEWIMSARVLMDLSDVRLASDITLELFGVETPWTNENPTWFRPWDSPGGDTEEWTSVETLASRGFNSGLLVFDVTEIVRRSVGGDRWVEGFMLVAYGPGRDGLLPAELAQLDGSIPVALEVAYRRTSALGHRPPRAQ